MLFCVEIMIEEMVRVMDFSPRLKQILLLILRSDSPIPAGKLAEHLQISKRTVFRELENTDKKIAGYHLILETTSKKGIFITGSQDHKNAFFHMLTDLDFIDPKNIEVRQTRLILELLKQEEPQKMYYFSQLLQVSESTVGHDLNNVCGWFSQNNIQVVRKPGCGIYIRYEEKDYRKACMRYVHRSMHESIAALYSLVECEITEHVIRAIRQTGHKQLNNMTDFSYTGLIIFLSVTSKRILMGRCISDCHEVSSEEKSSLNYGFVLQVVGILQRQFHVEFPVAEIDYFFIYVKGARLQNADKSEPVAGYFDLQCMVYNMIHQYDASIAFELKNDNEFVDGLIAHLKPTIVRLQSGHEICNPFQREVLTVYLDIYEKTKKAVRVLEETLRCQIPEEEIGLLALHFGGASVRHKNNSRLRRKANVGVVCASGIGISALLSSRLSNIFNEKINVKQLSLSDLDSKGMNGMDFIISTLYLMFPESHYLQIHPMLTEKDIVNISKRIEALTLDNEAAEENTNVNFISHVGEIKLAAIEIDSILKSFRLYFTRPGISFDELVMQTGQLAGENDSDRARIYRALIEREALSTQIIPEYEIVFLHAKTAYVKAPVFFLLRAEGAGFTEARLVGIKSVIVMIIPENDPRRKLAISSVSSEIFENEAFLEIIKYGEEGQIRRYIEKVLNCYLTNCIYNFKL